MQGVLLILIIILAVILYRLLSGQKITFTYVRTSQKESSNDNTEFYFTDTEKGFLIIDKDMIIVEEEEYSLKPIKEMPAEASLNIQDGRLISVTVKLIDGEKTYFIDPSNNLFNLRIPSANYSSNFSQLVAI